METRRSMMRMFTANRGEDGDELCIKRDGTTDDGCAYSTLRKAICSLEKDGSGKPVQKCETTEQRLRKCIGRPQEVLDSKVEITEQDVLPRHNIFSLDVDRSAGNRYTAPYQWHERRSGPGGAVARGEYPFAGLFERENPASLEQLVQDAFGGPFDLSQEVETAGQPNTAPSTAEHIFSWFRGGAFGDRSQKTPAPASPDQLNAQQKSADYYEALSRGIQEV